MGWAESEVNFYLTSTRREAAEARKWINAAYRRFPDPAGEFYGRLRSTDDRQHVSAIAELFVYDLLVDQHSRVVHEEGGIGPDFRIYSGEEYLGAVEVCTLFEKEEWETKEKEHSRIADQLNQRIPLDKWFIEFEVIRLDRQPSINRLAAWVQAEIAELSSRPANAVDLLTPWQSYRADGVELCFRFRRRQSSLPPKPTDRVVGMGQVSGGLVDSHLRLRSALEKKVQKRYDARGKPLAIFVNGWDSMCTRDEFEDALLGNVQVVVQSGEFKRANNGFFGRDRRRPAGKHEALSCVFALHGWRPWNPGSKMILRFDNPFTIAPFPDDLLPADHQLAVVRGERKRWLAWTPAAPPGW